MSEHFLKEWHRMVEARDPAVLAPLVSDQAILRSPAYWRPKQGKEAVLAVFGGVMSLLEDFQYQGQWVDGSEIILLFEGRLEGKTVRGIDRVVLDENGRLSELEVFVRPLSGLTLLAEHMGRYFEGSAAGT